MITSVVNITVGDAFKHTDGSLWVAEKIRASPSVRLRRVYPNPMVTTIIEGRCVGVVDACVGAMLLEPFKKLVSEEDPF